MSNELGVYKYFPMFDTRCPITNYQLPIPKLNKPTAYKGKQPVKKR
ncbi:MAG: hypothetical protein SWZ49_03150 [Cyanobacteriota bacterium]|nr:hypothetical protein [Cyanobacteriota bacterium]